MRARIRLVAALAAVSAAVSAPHAFADGATLYLSPTGSDSANCSAAAPCKTFDRAYRAAAPGDTVLVAAGSYPPGALRADPSKTDPTPVVFTPAPGANVVANLDVSASHVVFVGSGLGENFQLQWYARAGASDLTFRNIWQPLFGISSASGISILGGQVGPWTSGPAGEDPQVKAASGDAPPPSDITIDGVYFHDLNTAVGPDGRSYHTDCVQFGGGQHVVIRRNRFVRCSDTDLFVRSWARGPGDALADFTIENNFFGPTSRGFYDLQLADSKVPGFTCDDFVFRYNTVVGNSPLFNCAPPRDAAGAGRMYGNILPTVGRWTCAADTATGASPVRSYNVYASGSTTCDPTEIARGGVAFVDPGAFDYHLQPGSAGIAAGAPGDAPATDIDGNPRPPRAVSDAGAAQRDPVLIRIGHTLGAVRIGGNRADVTASYGNPVATRTRRYGRATPTVSVATYRAVGGSLWVVYDGDTVVGAGTTSPYYATATGAGVGAPVDPAKTGGLRWRACPGEYARTVGGVETRLVPSSKDPAAPIASVWLFQTRYRDAAPCGSL